MALGVVLAGGGTGGHIFPALALADAIRKHSPEARVSFIGTARGIEVTHVPRAGFELDLVPSAQVAGRGALGKLAGLAVAARGIGHAWRLLRARQTDVVIGVGGYASVPTVVAALWMRIPTLLLEPNAHPGRANRLLGRFAERVFVQFEDARAYFPAERAERVGLPVRALPERPQSAADRRPQLLVVGGSQGARSVNQAIGRVLPRLASRDLEIVHQTGSHDLEEVRRQYAAAGVSGDVEPFFDDLPRRLVACDVLLARAGASTIAELCCAGVAAVLVPYPHAADDHQMANARELEREGAAVVIPNSELDTRLGDVLEALLDDPTRRRELAEAAARRAQPNAAAHIWGRCVELTEGRS